MAQRQTDGNDTRACPPHDALLKWQQGQLSPEQEDGLSRHVDGCTACLKALETILAADPVSHHLRQRLPVLGEDERAEKVLILQRVHALAATPNPSGDNTCVPSERSGFHFLEQPERPDEIGRLGQYRIRRLLGQGGMGLVFEAEDVGLGRPVALKVLRPEAEQKPGARERFLREARAAAAVRHEHVVLIHHVGEIRDVPFLVMEVLAGQSLEARCRSGPVLAFPDIVRVGREVAEGLAAAHDQGLTHRDVKPDNIWLGTPPPGAGGPAEPRPPFRVKLLDFGLARAAGGDVQLTQNGLVVGTPAYMAPEQACGEPVDARTDLFSLGCVLYRLATGRLPFEGKTPLAILRALANDTPPPPRHLNPEVPESFSRLVAALLARRPADRPASARAVVQALTAVEQECAAPAPKPRPRTALVLALVGLLTLGLAAAAVMMLRLQTEQGELVIRADDPDVAVLFEQGKVRLHDRKSDRKYSLVVGSQKRPSGEYELEVTDEVSGLTFSTREFTLRRGEPVQVRVSLVPKGPGEPGASATGVLSPPGALQSLTLPARPRLVPADALKRSDIPADVLARVGGGDPAKAPPELVAVLGGPRQFRIAWPTNILFLHTRYSPDGRFLATCAATEADVYDASSGAVLWRFAHEKLCSWLEFRSDNRVLAVSHMGGISFWDLNTGTALGTLPGIAQRERGVTFTPDGRSLVTCDYDGKARVRDVGHLALASAVDKRTDPVRRPAAGELRLEAKVLQTFDPPAGYRFAQVPQVHPEGRLVALYALGPKPVVRVLDLSTGRVEAELPGTRAENFQQATLRFSPDGRLLASFERLAADSPRLVHLWDTTTWKEVGKIEGHADNLSFNANGSTLLQGVRWHGGTNVILSLYDVRTRARRTTLVLPLPADAVWADLSPDGGMVAVRALEGSSLRLFDSQTGEERFAGPGHTGPVTGVAVSPDGRWLASSGYDHRVLLWDLQTGKEARKVAFARQSYNRFRSVAFSPDGKTFGAVMLPNELPGAIRMWETATGKELRSLPAPAKDGQPREFAFHPAGSSLVSARDAGLQQWPLPQGAPAAWQGANEKPVFTVAYDPTGRRLASGDQDGVVCVWDAETCKPLHQFRCKAPVRRVRFSPHGAQLAAVTAAPDAALYLWDVQTQTQVRREGHTDTVTGLAWQPDGQGLATASADGTVALWSLNVKQPPRTFRLHAGAQEQLAFTPEGRHLVTAAGDGSVYVLRLAPSP